MTYTHGGLFSGVGGFDEGFRAHGIPTLFCVEKDPQCRAVLKRHNPAAQIFDDVCTVGAHNLPPVDILSFGSPCQDLSVAGKRKGLDGARSGLFYEAVRIIAECRPAFAVWENVPGALSSNSGRDFGAVLDALADIGAVDIAWRILDARYFGTPQRRRHIFLVADFRGERCAEILALADSVPRDTAPRRTSGQDLAYALTARAAHDRPEPGAATLVAAPTFAYGIDSEMNAEAERIVPIRSHQSGGAELFACVPEASQVDGSLLSSTLRGFGHGWQGQHNSTNAVIAGSVSCKWAKGTGGPAGDECQNKVLTPAVCFEPGNLSRRCGSEPNTLLTPTLGASSQGDKFPCVAVTTAHTMQNGLGLLTDGTIHTLDSSGGDAVGIPAMAFREKAGNCYHSNVGATLLSDTGETDNMLPSVTFYENHAQDSRITEVRVSPALSRKAGTGGNNLPLAQSGMTVRRLTPMECERLQGFPDGHTAWGLSEAGARAEMSDSTRYRMMGNAVNVAVSTWLAGQFASLTEAL